MPSKKQYSTLLIDTETGKDPSFRSKFDVRDVIFLMGTAYNDVVAAHIKINGLANIDGGFIKVIEDVPIMFNLNRGIYYSNFPTSTMQLSNDMGIRQISPMQDEENPFIKVKSGDAFVYSGLESDYAIDLPEYWIEGNKVVYRKLPPQFTKVLFKVIENGSVVDEDYELNIPAGFQDDLFNRVLTRLRNQNMAPEDKINDNNPNL